MVSDELLLSVCVAVYNVKPYLRECLESLKAQTLRPVEFIVVDDGSTDGSSEVCDEVARGDSRFRVIHHDGNRGSLVARKTGMEAARGKYTTFLDGDDCYTTPESLAMLVQLMEHRGADTLRFACRCFGDDPLRVSGAEWWTKVWASWPQAPGKEALESVFAKGEFCWNVIFTCTRTEIVKRVAALTPDVHCICAEDAFQFFLTVVFSSSVAIDRSAPLYAYRVGNGVSTWPGTLARFPNYAKEVRVTRWLEQVLEAEGVEKSCFETLARLKHRLLRTSCERLVLLPPQERSAAFDLLAAEGEGPAMLRAMREVCSSSKKMGELALNLRGARSLVRQERPAKTVAVLYRRFYDGGVERVMSLQIPELLAAGCRVVLLTEEVKPDIEYPLPAGVVREVLPARFEDGRLEALEATLKRQAVDVVMYHQASSRDALWDLLAMKLLGVSVVVQLHELPGQDAALVPSVDKIDFEAARPYVYRLADRLLVLSETFKTYFEAFGCRVSVVANPPTFDLASTPVRPVAERQGVLWLGRLQELQKNWTDALRIMERLAQLVPGVQCYMGGSEYDAGSEAAVRKFIAEHHLEDTIHWIGRQTDVQALMSRCRVFLLTSSFESFSMVLAEAKACGAPVVVYDMPYLELLQSEAGCKVVRQRDTEAAASAAADILLDDSLCEQLIKASRASVEEFYRLHAPASWLRAMLGKEHQQESAVLDGRLQQCFEYLTAITRGAVLMEENWRAADVERRRRRKIHVGRVVKYAILGKMALTHDKRRHYRDKLRQLFD